MDLTPSQVAAASFRTVRKGYDPDEVAAFLAARGEGAGRIAAAGDGDGGARPRRGGAAAGGHAAAEKAAARPSARRRRSARRPADVVHVVAPTRPRRSRARCVLAQRTADAADRRCQGRGRAAARRGPRRVARRRSTRPARCRPSCSRTPGSKPARLPRRSGIAAENEVQSLVARREFLVGDVDQLEQFLIDQRERLRAAARQLEAMCDRVPAGLGARASAAAVGVRRAARRRHRRALPPPGAEALGSTTTTGRPTTTSPTTTVDDETAAVLEATARRRRPVDDATAERDVDRANLRDRVRAEPGNLVPNGVDEAITSEPPEERRIAIGAQ